MIDGKSINYVIACWAGNRRVADPRITMPGGMYLEKHIQSLQISHHLDQITVLIPECHSTPPSFWNIVDRIPKQINNAKVVIACRENSGMSYGSWSRAYDYYRTDFDYYFFMEDDYKFCQDDFDRKMIELFNVLPKCGYLAGQVWTCGNIWPLHAGMSCGLAISTALERSYKLLGFLPYISEKEKKYVTGERSQVIFSRGISVDVGYNLFDVSSRYRIAFRKANFKVNIWHTANKTMILDVI